MKVRTKKYQLDKKKYRSIAMNNIIRSWWWAFIIPLAIAGCTFLVPTTNWFWISALILLALYFLFWFIQFTGVTQMEQTRILFDKLAYEIDSKQILIKIDKQKGMPVNWDQIKNAEVKKDAFILVMNKVQLIHLPFKIFNGQNEVKFVESILKRKGFIKA